MILKNSVMTVVILWAGFVVVFLVSWLEVVQLSNEAVPANEDLHLEKQEERIKFHYKTDSSLLQLFNIGTPLPFKNA